MSVEVAIIIPTCNRSELLERAVDSALNQTVSAKVVVVNDGSSPLSKDDRVIQCKTLHPLSGPSSARNVGLEMVKDEVGAICYLDDDDELLPEYVETQVPLLKEKEFGFSTALYQYEDGTKTTDPDPMNNGPKRYYDPAALMEQNVAPISCFIHTTKAFSEVKGWDETLLRMEDWDFWGRMAIAMGEPSWSPKITNIIHKGASLSRSDHNAYAYAMSCHWRDIVADRLRFLSENKRCVVRPEDPVPRVPLLSLVAEGDQDWGSLKTGNVDCEIVLVHWERVNGPPGLRLFIPPGDVDTPVKRMNYGFLLSRSKYVWFGREYDDQYFCAVKSDPLCDAVHGSKGVLCNRRVIEKLSGLDSALSLEEAVGAFLEEAKRSFDVREM